MVIDGCHMVLNLLLWLHLNLFKFFCYYLLNFPKHLQLAFIHSIILIICFVYEDMNLGLWVFFMNVLIDVDKILNGLLVRLLLDIYDVNYRFCIFKFFYLVRFWFFDVKIAWKIIVIKLDIRPNFLQMRLHLFSLFKHLSLHRIHLC